ncbi:MAG: AmmeMemoRadiSam system protein B [Desulfonauticus sp.]|nr:AmmeMemoRadiSam system protein B [Desulfonauticus sp.]
MDRNPVVSGQFYPAQKELLAQEVRSFLQGHPRSKPTLLSMVPHAGYVFSGAVCGKTLAQSNLKSTILLLGPNHTGRGQRLALWPDGKWYLPGGYLQVAEEISSRLLSHSLLQQDYEAHLFEHSLEVILPFLFYRNPEIKIIPICVAEHNLQFLKDVADFLAAQLSPEEVTIIVSSDMSHYIPHHLAEQKDKKTLQYILQLDPRGFINFIQKEHVSMCGVLPMLLGLFMVQHWGASCGVLIDYRTSGEVNKDFNQVVGYAGVIIE